LEGLLVLSAISAVGAEHPLALFTIQLKENSNILKLKTIHNAFHFS
jgi:hypothetical protein